MFLCANSHTKFISQQTAAAAKCEAWKTVVLVRHVVEGRGEEQAQRARDNLEGEGKRKKKGEQQRIIV